MYALQMFVVLFLPDKLKEHSSIDREHNNRGLNVKSFHWLCKTLHA